MTTKVKKVDKRCEEHLFSLKALKNDCYYTQAITCCFCDGQKTKSNSKESFNYPIFNKDLNFGTPCFILPLQKFYFTANSIKLNIQHQKKTIDYTDSKSQILVPKPKSKNNYCSVCKNNYEDYLIHINSNKHKNKINASTFNKYIMELTSKFQSKIQNSVDNPQVIDDDDIQLRILAEPKKKLKQQNFINYQNIQEQLKQSLFNSFQNMQKYSFSQHINPFGFGFNFNPFNLFNMVPQLPTYPVPAPQITSQYRYIIQPEGQCVIVPNL